MNERPESLDAALRAPEPSLADDNFTETVLGRLPPRRRRTAARRWTVAGSAALGSALTLAFAAPLDTVLASISPWPVPMAISAVAVIAIVALPALLVFFTERADR